MAVRSFDQLFPGRDPSAPAHIPVSGPLCEELGESLRVEDCYCPQAECACERAVLRLWAEGDRAVAAIDCVLRPLGAEERFDLDVEHPQGPLADEVLDLIRAVGIGEELRARITARYDEVKGTALALASQGLIPGSVVAPSPPPRSRIGRNDRCPCGSGKKYKRCCMGVERDLLPLASAFQDEGDREATRWREAIDREFPVAIPEHEIHPYVDLSTCFKQPDREVLSPEERAMVDRGLDPAKLRGFSIEQLLGLLAERGIDDDPVGRFEELAGDAWFASDVAAAWIDEAGLPSRVDVDGLLGFVAVELWRRTRPDVPCFELIFERMEEGYAHLKEGRTEEACAAWWWVWRPLALRLSLLTGCLEGGEEVFPAFRFVREWWWDFSDALLRASAAGSTWIEQAIRFHRETLVTFPGEDPELLGVCRDTIDSLVGSIEELEGAPTAAVTEGAGSPPPDAVG